MLVAMNTGHMGSLSTLHANSPRDAVIRLSTMVRLGAELPVDVIERQVGSAIDLIVQVERSSSGERYVCQICQVGLAEDGWTLLLDEVYIRDSFQAKGGWKMAPLFVKRLADKDVATEEEVEEWISELSLPSQDS